jgi:hypothetical protein
MFEMLSLIGIIMIAASIVKRSGKADRNSDANSDANSTQRSKTQPVRARAAEIAPKAELTIRQNGESDGTYAVPRDARFGFVAGFGVKPESLKELHIYSVAGQIEAFPQRVVDLLNKLYTNGFAVGEEIMAVLHHGRPLKEGEAIYVAVAHDDASNLRRTVAFLDRRRAC